MEFQGCGALVTGGGTGIGRGIALALARRGARVVLVGRRAGPLAATAAEIAEAGGIAIPLPADLADERAREALWHRATEANAAPPALLVHCAAQFAGGPLADRSDRALSDAITVNLLAPLELTRQAVPDLTRDGGGVVVLVGSLTGVLPLPYAALYGGTKAGVAGAAASLGYELAPVGVGLLLVLPPATATPVTARMAEQSGHRWRLARPEVVGERVAAALADGRTGTLDLLSPAERAARFAHRIAPGLVRAVLSARRVTFARAFSGGDADD